MTLRPLTCKRVSLPSGAREWTDSGGPEEDGPHQERSTTQGHGPSPPPNSPYGGETGDRREGGTGRVTDHGPTDPRGEDTVPEDPLRPGE